ncbi:MAG TPA: hypothetical protein VF058_04535 [Actinomycetota bacterium]
MLPALARGRRVATIVAITAALMMLGQTAQTVPVSLDGSNSEVWLFGAGHTRWDVDNNAFACEADLPGYAPVDDGEIGLGTGRTDAFDGGLLLMVGPPTGQPDDATTFHDSDSIVDKVGEQVKAGPELLEGLRVTRLDRVLPKTPTMRTLVALRNTTGSAKARDIYLDSDLGSDSNTEIRGSSNGSATLLATTRWAVTSDSATDPGDPVVTHVLWGKKAPRRTTEVLESPSGANTCMVIRMRIRVPRKSVRYLLFFAEMTPTNIAGVNGAGKFNKRKLNKALLAGIGKKVRGRILNWKLT